MVQENIKASEAISDSSDRPEVMTNIAAGLLISFIQNVRKYPSFWRRIEKN